MYFEFVYAFVIDYIKYLLVDYIKYPFSPQINQVYRRQSCGNRYFAERSEVRWFGKSLEVNPRIKTLSG